MVIQRWQTLLLMAAVVLMALLSFTPAARLYALSSTDSYTALYLTDAPVLLVIDLLVAVLLFISVFMFKNLRQQMRVTLLSLLLMCVLIVGGAFIVARNSPYVQIEWGGAVLLLACAAVLTLGAWRLMRRDRNLLRSADRLR